MSSRRAVDYGKIKLLHFSRSSFLAAAAVLYFHDTEPFLGVRTIHRLARHVIYIPCYVFSERT